VNEQLRAYLAAYGIEVFALQSFVGRTDPAISPAQRAAAASATDRDDAQALLLFDRESAAIVIAKDEKNSRPRRAWL